MSKAEGRDARVPQVLDVSISPQTCRRMEAQRMDMRPPEQMRSGSTWVAPRLESEPPSPLSFSSCCVCADPCRPTPEIH